MKRRTPLPKAPPENPATGRGPRAARITDPEAAAAAARVQYGKDPDRLVKELEQQRLVLMLRTRGVSPSQIAARLGVDVKTVQRLRARAYEDYLTDHQEFMDRHLAEAMVRYEALFQVYVPKALGWRETDPETGAEIVHPPDKDAAKIVMRGQRDMNLLISHGQPIRVEHTGAGGGPVVTAHVDAMERARLIREDFRRRATGVATIAVNPIPDDSGATQH